jgi:SAM-dependent methyltransferase
MTPAASDGETGAQLARLYAARFSEEERVQKAALWRAIWQGALSRYVPPGATVVDLGAGYCDLINCVEAARRIAIDLNPDTRRYAAPGVEVQSRALTELPALLPAGSVDVAFASNVFEHLRSPEALLEVLAGVRTVLKPRGRIVILQPNVRLVGGAFWDFFDHTLPLTERGMAEALTTAGFRVVECRARFLPYTTKSRVPQHPALVRLYLACPPIQWLLGKQMLVVAQPTADEPSRPRS